MEPKLEAIKGGGGSIKVGTTGTISALMSRELEPQKSSSKTSADEGHETRRRTKHHPRSTHQIPMLTSDDISIDGTPIRQKPVKKGPNVVEIVDIKCGYSNRTITDRLKKLGFSKLSESIV